MNGSIFNLTALHFKMTWQTKSQMSLSSRQFVFEQSFLACFFTPFSFQGGVVISVFDLRLVGASAAMPPCTSKTSVPPYHMNIL